ncbi:MAG: hypothetical protein K8R25_13830 [Methanosarcinales archaeon]|nr:hypothetical protein [Methanosarcinales archaeon]
MKDLACPLCGRITDHYINGLCRDCFLKNITIANVPQVIHTIICAACGAVKKGRRWEMNDTEIEELIKEQIIRSVKINPIIKDYKISIRLTSRDPRIFNGKIVVNSLIDGIKTDTELQTQVRVKKETCVICSRRAGGYYEAMVQIRANERFPDEDEQDQVLDMIFNIVDRQYNSGNGMSFITKIEKLHEGTDVYLGSNSIARQICRTASGQFGANFSESSTLAGRKDGENIYRITYSLKLPRFVPGDIIRFTDEIILIRHSGKRTSGLNLETGHEFVEHTNKLKDANKVSDAGCAVSTVLISVEGDTVQVMHPQTYLSVTLPKPAYISGTGGEEIKIVNINDSLVILPPG